MLSGVSTEDSLFDDRITSYPWPLGIAAGIASFVLGYVVMAGVVLSTAEFAEGTPAEFKLKIVGFVFYNAQQIPIQITGTVSVLGGQSSQNFLTGGGLSLPVFVYYAVPVLVLAGVGLLLAAVTLDPDRADFQDYVLPGAAITAGYVLSIVTARFLLQRTVSQEGIGSATAAPNLALTVVFGLVYPLVLATAASLAAGALGLAIPTPFTAVTGTSTGEESRERS